MLKIAKRKAKQQKIKMKFLRGDMRTIKVGKFDAAITIFNAIGHLTKAGFAKTMRNIYRNLNDGGIFIFDIINLNYVLDKDNIMKMSMERIGSSGNIKVRELQHSIIDNSGILTSYSIFYTQKVRQSPKVASKNIITLQLYTANELRDMLAKNGFKVLSQFSIDGSKFNDKKTERIVTVARKNREMNDSKPNLGKYFFYLCDSFNFFFFADSYRSFSSISLYLSVIALELCPASSRT